MRERELHVPKINHNEPIFSQSNYPIAICIAQLNIKSLKMAIKLAKLADVASIL